MDEDEADNYHAMEVHFSLKLLDWATDHDHCHNYPGIMGFEPKTF